MLIQSEHDGHYLTFNDDEHTYQLDGRLIPGVTTILHNGLPTNHTLITWMNKQSGWYVVDQLKQFPEQVNRLPNYLLDEIVKKSTHAGKAKAKEAASIGSVVHLFAECDLMQQPFDQSLINDHLDRGKIELCIKEYLKWRQESGYKTIDCEQIVASVKHQFAGKYDYLASNKNKIILIDFKTSGSIYSSHKIQVGGAYRSALSEWRGISVDGIDLVRFGKDGSFEHCLVTKKKELKDYEDQFIRCLDTYRFGEKYDL